MRNNNAWRLRVALFVLSIFGIVIVAEARQAPQPTPSPAPRRRRVRKPIIGATETAPTPAASPTPRPSTKPPTPPTAVRRTVPEAGAWKTGTLLCTLESPFIDESSGVVASRRNPDVFWTHNDSGDGAYLYAFDRKGKTVGIFLVRTAFAYDWEDIAWGPGPDGKGNFLYIGDIGDYPRDRTDACVYRIAEPSLAEENRVGTKARPRLTGDGTARLLYAFPDGAHDSETLMVHPKTGTIYIVTKEDKGETGVYKFPPIKPTDPASMRYTLIKIGALTFAEEGLHSFPNRVTGGDIAADGKRLILRTYYAAYEWRLPDGERDFDAIWTTNPVLVPLPFQPQGEGICYTADGAALITTSEKKPTNVYELRAR